jgi:hypothetical protein
MEKNFFLLKAHVSPSRKVCSTILLTFLFYPKSFLIFIMASFQEHPIYEKKTTHIKRTHTDKAFYTYRFVYRYTVLLDTTCTGGLHFCVHICTLLHNLTLPTHTCCAPTMLGSACTPVLLYCSPVTVQLYTCAIEPGEI